RRATGHNHVHGPSRSSRSRLLGRRPAGRACRTQRWEHQRRSALLHLSGKVWDFRATEKHHCG
ncbi:tubulin folding cofactor b, partial [Nannochloropsis oceanica]